MYFYQNTYRLIPTRRGETVPYMFNVFLCQLYFIHFNISSRNSSSMHWQPLNLCAQISGNWFFYICIGVGRQMGIHIVCCWLSRPNYLPVSRIEMYFQVPDTIFAFSSLRVSPASVWCFVSFELAIFICPSLEMVTRNMKIRARNHSYRWLGDERWRDKSSTIRSSCWIRSSFIWYTCSIYPSSFFFKSLWRLTFPACRFRFPSAACGELDGGRVFEEGPAFVDRLCGILNVRDDKCRCRRVLSTLATTLWYVPRMTFILAVKKRVPTRVHCHLFPKKEHGISQRVTKRRDKVWLSCLTVVPILSCHLYKDLAQKHGLLETSSWNAWRLGMSNLLSITQITPAIKNWHVLSTSRVWGAVTALRALVGYIHDCRTDFKSETMTLCKFCKHHCEWGSRLTSRDVSVCYERSSSRMTE